MSGADTQVDRRPVGGLLHHAQEPRVPFLVSADGARRDLRQVEALLAEPDLLLHLRNRVGQLRGALQSSLDHLGVVDQT